MRTAERPNAIRARDRFEEFRDLADRTLGTYGARRLLKNYISILNRKPVPMAG